MAATLELKTLRCKRRKDLTGKDEPRLTVDGVRVWNGVVKKGGSDHIGVTVEFEDEVRVIAEEMNGTKAKQIGDAVTVRESGNPKYLTFKTSGAWYEVDFKVTELPSSSTSGGRRRAAGSGGARRTRGARSTKRRSGNKKAKA